MAGKCYCEILNRVANIVSPQITLYRLNNECVLNHASLEALLGQPPPAVIQE